MDTLALPELSHRDSGLSWRLSWRAALIAQLLACAFAVLSSSPIGRWIWLSALGLLLASVLNPIRDALQCSAGPARHTARFHAFGEILTGGGLIVFMAFVLMSIFADSTTEGLKIILGSATLQRHLWSDGLLWPATFVVASAHLAGFATLLPRLRRDVAHYPGRAWRETCGRGVGTLLGIALGAWFAVYASWHVAVAMTAVCLVVEHQWLSRIPGPDVVPVRASASFLK